MLAPWRCGTSLCLILDSLGQAALLLRSSHAGHINAGDEQAKLEMPLHHGAGPPPCRRQASPRVIYVTELSADGPRPLRLLLQVLCEFVLHTTPCHRAGSEAR